MFCHISRTIISVKNSLLFQEITFHNRFPGSNFLLPTFLTGGKLHFQVTNLLLATVNFVPCYPKMNFTHQTIMYTCKNTSLCSSLPFLSSLFMINFILIHFNPFFPWAPCTVENLMITLRQFFFTMNRYTFKGRNSSIFLVSLLKRDPLLTERSAIVGKGFTALVPTRKSQSCYTDPKKLFIC